MKILSKASNDSGVCWSIGKVVFRWTHIVTLGHNPEHKLGVLGRIPKGPSRLLFTIPVPKEIHLLGLGNQLLHAMGPIAFSKEAISDFFQDTPLPGRGQR